MRRLIALMVGVMGLGLVSVLPACVAEGPTVSAFNNAAPQAPVAEMYGLDLEQKQHARTFSTQPPMIPHKTNYDISLKANGCMKCHDPANAKKEEAPAAGKSHYVDASGKVQDKLLGTRYFCTQCHAPMTKATPLVENTFQGDVPAAKAK
ncbi:MAG: nitrate reductase cytochrome c-type subunit [Magnetospirillum sp. WYHS-4]